MSANLHLLAARLAAVAVLALGLALAAPGVLAQEPYLRNSMLAEDDPQGALDRARTEFETSPDPLQRYWLQLAMVRALNLLEDPVAAARELAAAKAALQAMPAPPPDAQAWFELESASSAIRVDSATSLHTRLVNLRELARRVGDPRFACEVTVLDMWVLNDSRSFDEAWIAAEEVERCARALDVQALVPQALSIMGNIAVAMPSERNRTRDAVELLQRALAALGPNGARFRRSIVEWDLAHAYQQRKDWDRALLHLRNALALSENLRDTAGLGAARIELARVHLERGEPGAALTELALAESKLLPVDTGSRMVTVSTLRLQALTRLQRPEVLDEIVRARRWDSDSLQPVTRARLARAMAQGYASRQRWREAYAETERATAFDEQARALANDSQALRLQARYDGMRRDAETAELRHREESSRLALQAEAARQRALWAALALLGTVLLAAAAGLTVLARRRRVLADLALKDELTGAPNRRAVAAYAQAQFEQTRRLSMPITVALVDFDHFKRINDTWGHPAGDALLRAFATAAASVLRGQDRLGRWGGEEWLLVMPGTPEDELPHVFERLKRAFAALEVQGLPSPHGCTFSMGAAQASPETSSFDALVALADRRLYQAKQQGRDRLQLGS